MSSYKTENYLTIAIVIVCSDFNKDVFKYLSWALWVTRNARHQASEANRTWVLPQRVQSQMGSEGWIRGDSELEFSPEPLCRVLSKVPREQGEQSN